MQKISLTVAIIFVVFAACIAVGYSALTSQKNCPQTAGGRSLRINGAKQNVKKVPKLRKRHGQLKGECGKFKSGKMRALCNSLATDPVIRKMGTDCRGYANVSKANAFLDKRTRARSRTVVVLPSDPFAINPPPSGNTPVGYQCTKVCPDYSCASSPPINISPHESCLHYDPLRFPQWLVLGFCSCEGCINFETGKEDLSFRSVPIVTQLTVIMRNPNTSFDECKTPSKDCWKEKLEMSVGCHCIMPRSA